MRYLAEPAWALDIEWCGAWTVCLTVPGQATSSQTALFYVNGLHSALAAGGFSADPCAALVPALRLFAACRWI